MDLEAISRELKHRFSRRTELSSKDQLGEWNSTVAALVEQVDPSQAQAMRQLAARLALPLSSYTLEPLWSGVQQIVRDVIAKLDQGLYDERLTMASKTPRVPQNEPVAIPTLRVPPEVAKVRLKIRIVDGETLEIRCNSIRSEAELEVLRRDKQAWHEYNQTLLATLFQGGTFADQYNRRSGIVVGLIGHDDLRAQLESLRASLLDKIGRLTSISEQVDLCEPPAGPQPSAETSAVDRVIRLCKRFPAVARQLKTRHGGRPPLLFADEYDVQDVFRALLQIDFGDVRPEEWTPSYAGSSSRMDFLLKKERVVLETKMTREGLATAKQVANELLIDIARYREHGDCRELVCFVYDPDGRLGNPAALENDLSRPHDGMSVHVVVAPHD